MVRQFTNYDSGCLWLLETSHVTNPAVLVLLYNYECTQYSYSQANIIILATSRPVQIVHDTTLLNSKQYSSAIVGVISPSLPSVKPKSLASMKWRFSSP